MITRFFKKKKPSAPEPRKKAEEKRAPKKQTPSSKVLTAEGWKRLMMRAHKKS